MIQGGDPNTKNSLRKDTYGQGGPKDEKGNPILLKAEFSDTPHKRGIVSMARANEPDTAGSQFFIVVEPSPFLDRKYTAFGEVTRGLGVADKIVIVPRNDHDLPNERIEMTVTIVEYSSSVMRAYGCASVRSWDETLLNFFDECAEAGSLGREEQNEAQAKGTA